jgi:hypothetical protein
VCRPVGGRDSSGGGRVKTEGGGGWEESPETRHYTEREVDICLYRAATPYRGRMMVCVRTASKAVFVRCFIPGPRWVL